MLSIKREIIIILYIYMCNEVTAHEENTCGTKCKCGTSEEKKYELGVIWILLLNYSPAEENSNDKAKSRTQCENDREDNEGAKILDR